MLRNCPFPSAWLSAAILAITLFSVGAIRVAQADTLLVGTSLAPSDLVGEAELCPRVSDCQYLLSQFSTPVAFVVDDVKVALTGPGFFGIGGDFSVSLVSEPGITEPGGNGDLVADIGSGSFGLSNPRDNIPAMTEIFDFNHLSILIEPGIEYYLLVTGQDLYMDTSVALTGLGMLGEQLYCDPTVSTCVEGRYDAFPRTLAMQISGDPVPEPSNILLFSTGVLATITELRRRIA
jgi:hypothetical protein